MDATEALVYLRDYNLELHIMEVCGTHTAALARHGLRSLLSPAISLVSGPGCPVCVTPPSYIDALIELAMRPNHVVVSFGDMFRVRGNRESSLEEARADGASVALVYSPLETLAMAKSSRGVTFIVAAAGFETTAPVYAVLLDKAREAGLGNIRLAMALKTMPPALEYICRRESLDAFICPGHVSTIIGCEPYETLCRTYRKPFVIAGFEPEHLIAAIYEIAKQHAGGAHAVRNLYPSAVTGHRQARAWDAVERYFIAGPGYWRGIGELDNSGLHLRDGFSHYKCDVPAGGEERLPIGCRCGDVLLGRISPSACPLYGSECTPERATGPCMVSSEGACGIWYATFGGRQ